MTKKQKREAKRRKEEEAKVEEEPLGAATPQFEPMKVPEKKKKFNCRMCPGANYDTRDEFKAHFKSDWHVFNLKRKNKVPTPPHPKKLPPLSEVDYKEEAFKQEILNQNFMFKK